MSISVNFLMPDLAKVKVKSTSALQLGIEAEKRGYQICHTRETDVCYREGKVIARARDAKNFKLVEGNVADLSEFYDMNLADVDVVLSRPAMKFNLHFISITHILEHLKGKTLVVDDPAKVRECAEKLLITRFPDLTPETLISSDPWQINEFRNTYKDIIVKPLFGYGGEGIFHIKPESDNLTSLLEMFENLYHEPVMIQRYLPDIKGGDKRILMIDGKAVGTLLRRPVEGNARANVTAGGSAELSVVTKRDQEICDRVAPVLNEMGIILAGLDVIGDYLVEINVGTVGGILEIEALGGGNMAGLFWDAVEKRL